MSRVALVSTTHDPGALQAPFIAETIPKLLKIYERLCVVMTPATHQATADELRRAGVLVRDTATAEIGESRRRALKLGLEQTTASFFHYCDLDRLIYWQLNEPQELSGLVSQKIPTVDFLAHGRTPHAFQTHPPAQIETESLTNIVFSHVFGADRLWDVVAGSCSLSRPAAQYLLSHSTAASNATDTEWPMIISQRPEFAIDYVETSGLAFETELFFGPETFLRAAEGENWHKRVKLTRESVEAALRWVMGDG